MVRSATRCVLGVLLAGLATACLGGQTGAPSARCFGDIEHSATDRWGNTTVAAAAASFEGTYVARLEWRQQEPSSSEQTPVAFDDELELTIDYRGADAVEEPCTSLGLRVPVVVTLSSSASGISEAHEAELLLTGSAGQLSGSLHYRSERVELDVTLGEVAQGARLSGSLGALDAALPGAAAEVLELE